MLRETLLELIQAYKDKDEEAKEKIFRLLEKAGMDRYTAKIAANELLKEELAKKRSESNGQG